MRRFVILSLILFISIPFLVVPIQAQTDPPPNVFIVDASQIYDGTATTLTGARMQAMTNQFFMGEGSWQATGTTQTVPGLGTDEKAAFYILPGTFGLPTTFKIGDITRIAWASYRDVGTGIGTPRANTGGQRNDFYLTIYASPWGTGRLQTEVQYAYNLDMPNATWVTWDTDSSVTNRLSFHDSSTAPGAGTWPGFYNGPTWADILAGDINWSNYSTSNVSTPSTNMDYYNRDVFYLMFETGNPWDAGFDGYLDAIIIEIDTDGDGTADVRSIIDLEATLPEQPTISKSFTPPSIINGTTSTLTFELTSDTLSPISGLAFTDNLPAGVEIASAPNVSITTTNSSEDCAFNVSAPAGGTTISVSNGYAPRGSSSPTVCEISVDVTSNTLGTYNNVTSVVTSDTIPTAGTTTAQATLTVTSFTVDSAQTTSGALTNGAIFTANQDTIAITFTADVFNTTDTTDLNYADSASNPANYVLLQGDAIATTSCNAINPSDTRITAFTVNHDSASRASTLTFAPPLTDGIYRLLVCGTTSIVLNADPSVHLNGGTDVTFNFTINTTPPVGPTPIGPTPTSPTPIPGTGTGTGALPQPEALNVTELPATGETPAWADLLRWILGW